MVREAREKTEIRPKAALILKAAVEIFANKGFHEASVWEIGQAAEAANGLMYNYFINKLDLLLSITFIGWKKINNLIAVKLLDIESPVEKLEMFLKTLWRFFTEDEASLSLAKILLTEELSPDYRIKEKELKKKRNLIRLEKARFFSSLRAVIWEAQSRGLFDKSVKDGAMAQVCYGSVRKLALGFFNETFHGEPAGYDVQDVNKAIEKLVRSFLKEG